MCISDHQDATYRGLTSIARVQFFSINIKACRQMIIDQTEVSVCKYRQSSYTLNYLSKEIYLFDYNISIHDENIPFLTM